MKTIIEKKYRFSLECMEAGQMLLFRDWLRIHEEDRIGYAQTKRKLARQTWKYVQDYADAKQRLSGVF